MKKIFLILVGSLICALALNFMACKNSSVVVAETTQQIYVVSFDSQGGSAVASQNVVAGGLAALPAKPTKTISYEIFAGWFYTNAQGDVTMWNFDDAVHSNLNLYAKWVSLTCENENLLTQSLKNLSLIEFSIDVNEGVEWYVDNVLQVGITTNQFTYSAPAEVKTHSIHCVVDGVRSRTFLVKVDYYVPQSIEIFVESIEQNNMYTLSIKDAMFIDGSKCVWYVSANESSDEFTEIGVGTTLNVKIDNNCKILAMYNGEQNLVSNQVEISPEVVVPKWALILAGASFVLVTVVIVCLKISKKRYDY